MKNIIMLLTAIFLFAMMISPLNAQEEVGPPARAGITEACTTGWIGWYRPIQEIWHSNTTTWAWIGFGRNFWVQSSNDQTEDLFMHAVSSAHWARFFVTSCAGGYGNVSVSQIWWN